MLQRTRTSRSFSLTPERLANFPIGVLTRQADIEELSFAHSRESIAVFHAATPPTKQNNAAADYLRGVRMCDLAALAVVHVSRRHHEETCALAPAAFLFAISGCADQPGRPTMQAR